jgi:ATP-dependent DNA ligase
MITTKLNGNLSMPVPELRGSLASMKYPAFAELKADGEFTFIIYDGGNITTMNKYNKMRSDFPALNKIKTELEQHNVKSCTLLAELVYGPGKRNALYELLKNKESDSLGLYPFDILDLDGARLDNLPLVDRKEHLIDILGNLAGQVTMVHNKSQAEDCFKNAVLCGWEGVVIKSMDGKLRGGPCDWVKMKMKDRTDYQVWTVDSTQERIEVQVPSANGGITIVGCKAPMRYKGHIKIGDIVTIEHQGVLESGSLRHPVLIAKKEWC